MRTHFADGVACVEVKKSLKPRLCGWTFFEVKYNRINGIAMHCVVWRLLCIALIQA